MDDLTQIHGIGAATAQKLVAAGIDSFARLAAATPHDIDMAIDGGRPSAWPAWIAAAAKRAVEADQANQPPAENSPSAPETAAPSETPSPATALDQGGGADASGVGSTVPLEEPDPWFLALGGDLLAAIDDAAVARLTDRRTLVEAALQAFLRPSQQPQRQPQPEETPPALDDPAEPPILAIDGDRHPAELRVATIKGPREGRWRRGHHFTDQKQTFLISRESYLQLEADPLISIALLED